MLEAEGNLNPYLPHLCLYSQFSLSRGDIALQLAGLGIGEVVCCEVFSGVVCCEVAVLAVSELSGGSFTWERCFLFHNLDETFRVS